MLYPLTDLTAPFKPIDVFGVGLGNDGFIGQTIWGDAVSRSGLFTYRWASPSRDRAKCDQFRWMTGVAKSRVSHDFDALLAKAKRDEPTRKLVGAISTETPNHKAMLIAMINSGLFDVIIIDKPVVMDLAELEEVKAALRSHPDVDVIVTFNHNFNAPMFFLQELYAEAGGAEGVEAAEGGFLQNWFKSRIAAGQGGHKQQNSRLALQAGICDIATHVESGLSFTMQQPLVAVSQGGLGVAGDHGEKFFDNGTCRLHFGDGAEPTLRFHQALGDHLDDIFFAFTYSRGRFAGKKVMWKMEECGGNALLVGGRSADVMNPHGGDWTQRIKRAHGFSDRVNDIFSENPGGHGYDWRDFFRHLMYSAAGFVLRKRGLYGNNQMHPLLQQTVPLIGDMGTETLQFVHLFDHSNAADGERVNIENVTSTFRSVVA